MRRYQNLSCSQRKFFAERHGVKCLNRGCRHGWKEIRYTTPEQIAWVRDFFPTSKIILNYRGECNRSDIFGRNCTKVNKIVSGMQSGVKNLTNVFHLETEQLNNLTKWRDLAKFLGYNNCEARKVSSANLQRGYSAVKEQRTVNPWTCS